MITAPNYSVVKQYIIEELGPFWQKKEGVLALPIPAVPWPKEEPLPPRVKLVALPSWASDLSVNGSILVPEQFSNNTDDPAAWAATDWFSTLFWYLNVIPERVFEWHHGPIQSYSYRLQGWDQGLWDHAWVNRIALFLRRWAAKESHQTEDDVCGQLPKTTILLTHDLDAISKTFAIRMKQSAFHGFNAIRLFLKGQYAAAATKVLHARRFFFIRATLTAWTACSDWKRKMACAA